MAIILVAICVVVITLDYRQGPTGPLEAVGRTAVGVIAPIQEAVSKVTRPIGNFVTALTSLPTLKRENAELQAKVDQLEAQLSASSSSVVELQRYKELLDLQQSIDRDSTGALVISSGVSNLEWSLTIDKGSSDGVQVNDAVVASRGLVGRVIRVSGGAAQVQLITDPNEGVAGEVYLEEGRVQHGVVLGEGDQNMTMDLVDPETPTKDLINKPVRTIGWAIAGRTNLYPAHIAIGTVVRVLESAGDLAKQVEIAPAVDLSSVDTVLVIHQPEGV